MGERERHACDALHALYWLANIVTNGPLEWGDVGEENCALTSAHVQPHDYILECKFSLHLMDQGLGLGYSFLGIVFIW